MPREYLGHVRRGTRTVAAAVKVIRGARLWGWSVSCVEIANSGSTYFRVKRGRVSRLVRVADHDSNWAKKNRKGLDTRTGPNDLLRTLRWLRNAPPPKAEPAYPTADEERQLACKLIRELGQRARTPRRR